MKHTKGKWEVKKTLGYSVKVGDKYIAGIHGQEKKVKDDSKALGYRYDNSETVANANLIASAPAMLVMLKSLRIDIGDTFMGKTAGWNRQVDELIAKAEGSQK